MREDVTIEKKKMFILPEDAEGENRKLI